MDAQRMMMETAKPSPDGHGYGVEPGRRTDCWVLTVPESGDVYLREILPDASEGRYAVTTQGKWMRMAGTAASDFAGRLIAAGRDHGKMPEHGGQVAFAKTFGRELYVLMWLAFDHLVEPDVCRWWHQATPAWRKTLYAYLVGAEAHIGDLVMSEEPDRVQRAYYYLEQRAPDGSMDPERQSRAVGPREDFMAQTHARRRKMAGFEEVYGGRVFGRRA